MHARCTAAVTAAKGSWHGMRALRYAVSSVQAKVQDLGVSCRSLKVMGSRTALKPSSCCLNTIVLKSPTCARRTAHAGRCTTAAQRNVEKGGAASLACHALALWAGIDGSTTSGQCCSVRPAGCCSRLHRHATRLQDVAGSRNHLERRPSVQPVHHGLTVVEAKLHGQGVQVSGDDWNHTRKRESASAQRNSGGTYPAQPLQLHRLPGDGIDELVPRQPDRWQRAGRPRRRGCRRCCSNLACPSCNVKPCSSRHQWQGADMLAAAGVGADADRAGSGPGVGPAAGDTAGKATCAATSQDGVSCSADITSLHYCKGACHTPAAAGAGTGADTAGSGPCVGAAAGGTGASLGAAAGAVATRKSVIAVHV